MLRTNFYIRSSTIDSPLQISAPTLTLCSMATLTADQPKRDQDKLPRLRILLLGSGGREHALAYKLAQSPLVEHIFVAPGNGGTASTKKCVNIDIGVDEGAKLVIYAINNAVRHARICRQ